jgi:peptidyl-prolyl cis-trans isomerase SurA
MRFYLSILVFSALILNATAHAKVLDRLEASVNSNLILLSDVEDFRKTERLRSQLDPLFSNTSVAAKGPNATTAEIVSFLVDERLILQQFPVTDAEVEQEITSIQSTNHIDRAKLKGALSEQGFTFEEYFELIRVSAAKRNLIDRDIRTKVSITEDDVKNYFYNRYSKNSTAPLSYHIQIISVSLKSYKTPTAAKDTAIRALHDLKAGESFDEVAKRSSDDGSASAGGDLGSLTEDQVSPVIRDQLKKLKIGEITEVFGGNPAYYILKLVDVKSAENDRLEKLRDEIRGQLLASEYQHQIQLWLERQKQQAFIHLAGESSIPGVRPAP